MTRFIQNLQACLSWNIKAEKYFQYLCTHWKIKTVIIIQLKRANIFDCIVPL